MRQLALAAALLLAAPLALHAQETCRLGKVTEQQEPTYPRIFDKRPVQSTVLLDVTFLASGKVSAVKAVAGPTFLKGPASMFVQSWKAEPSSEPIRQCPVTIEYVIDGPSRTCEKYRDPEVTVQRIDAQHVNILLGCHN